MSGGNDASIRQDNFSGQQIIERQPKSADQRSVTAAQGEPRHADRTARACHGRKAERIRNRENVRNTCTSRNLSGTLSGVYGDAVHAAHVNDEPFA
jgi:hypothetical protein